MKKSIIYFLLISILRGVYVNENSALYTTNNITH